MSVFIIEIETAKLHIQLRWPTHILNINAGMNRYTSEVYEAVPCSPRYDNFGTVRQAIA